MRWMALMVLLPLCLAASPEPPVGRDRPAGPVLDDDGSGLPSRPEMDRLAATDVIACFEACLRRHQREITGYRCRLTKQERIGRTLHPPETIAVTYQERPPAVLLRWLSGARLAAATLYVAGENNDQLVVRPAIGFGLVKELRRDPLGADARNSGRYPLTEFGLKKGLERTWHAWKKARDQGRMDVTYHGIQKVPHLNHRDCYVWTRRTRPEWEDEQERREGLTDVWIAVDVETWLQTGARLTDGQGRLIASYAFTDVELNPVFSPKQFQPSALRQ